MEEAALRAIWACKDRKWKRNMLEFYRACKRFDAGQEKRLRFRGPMIDLRTVLSAVSLESDGPDAA